MRSKHRHEEIPEPLLEYFYFTIGACGAERSIREIFLFSGRAKSERNTRLFNSLSLSLPHRTRIVEFSGVPILLRKRKEIELDEALMEEIDNRISVGSVVKRWAAEIAAFSVDAVT